MAITGAGTKDSPWEVHSYNEIKTVSTYSDQYKVTDGMRYVVLKNDIDCNDYGDDWEWETISLGDNYDGSVCHFDLCGHTIKNIMIKGTSSLFKGIYFSGRISQIYSSVKESGKILNVFCNNSKNIFDGYSNTSGGNKTLLLYNIAMSVDFSSLTGGFFGSTFSASKCSLYFKSNKLLYNIANVRMPDEYVFKNCHIYFDIANWSGRTLFYDLNLNSKIFDGCLLEGKIGGLGDNGMNNDVIDRGGSSVQALSNCVFNVEALTWNTSYRFMGGASTGIINKEKFQIGIGESRHAYDSAYGLTAVTEEQMKDADYLNDTVGFTVVKIDSEEGD